MRRESATSTASLEIASDLACEIDGRPLSIYSANGRIVVEVPDVTTGLSLFQLVSSRGLRFRRLHVLKRLLERVGWALELRIDHRTIAAIGCQVGNPFWRLIGLPAMKLRPERLVSAWFSDGHAP